jgi:15-cis-phytoene synthase
MNLSGDTLESSYAFCRRSSRRSGSNFYLGFLLLPREKRRGMDALYAFMRHTDDLVDEAPTGLGDDLDATIRKQREQLHRWRSVLENSLAGGDGFDADPARISAGSDLGSEVTATAEFLLPALVDTVKKYRIPTEHLFAVLDGVEMDLDRRRYETFTELELYCRRVASAVGLACIHIWGFRGRGTVEGEAAIGHARQAGIAMQLTNILRDLKSDAAADRIYLPLEDLRTCGYSEEELKKGVVNRGFYRLMEMEIDRARQFYREGCGLMDWLDGDGRPIFGLMMSTYWGLLEKIARRPGDVFRRHVGLGKIRRIAMACRWALTPSSMMKKLDGKQSSVNS